MCASVRGAVGGSLSLRRLTRIDLSQQFVIHARGSIPGNEREEKLRGGDTRESVFRSFRRWGDGDRESLPVEYALKGTLGKASRHQTRVRVCLTAPPPRTGKRWRA